MLGSERELFAGAVRDAIAKHQASEGHDAPVDAALEALGWRDVLSEEPDAALACVVTALGAANASSCVLDDVLATALGAAPTDDMAVVLPRFAAWDPPGRIDGERLAVDGLATAHSSTATRIFVVAAGPGGLFASQHEPEAVVITPVAGIDPSYGIHTVRGETVGASDPLDAHVWERAIALGSRAVAHENRGRAAHDARPRGEHALERVQFDRPVASFQAVRHRLAEALVAIEALEATLEVATDGEPITATLAKVTATRAARTVSGHCQQVLAGIGFTTDHPFHRSLKRVTLLSGLFGSEDALTHAIGARLLRERRVPTLVEL